MSKATHKWKVGDGWQVGSIVEMPFFSLPSRELVREYHTGRTYWVASDAVTKYEVPQEYK